MIIIRTGWLCLTLLLYFSVFMGVPLQGGGNMPVEKMQGKQITLSYWLEPQNTDAEAAETKRFPYTETEVAMIEAVVMHEVGHCSRESKIAVANIILNRVKDGRFGDSVYEVLHRKGQFDAIHNYYDSEIVPDEACRLAVLDALGGEDNSQGALYYCNTDYIENPETIRWFHSLEFLLELDGQKLYKG